MLPDRVSNPGPLTYKSGALPIALCGPAQYRIENHLKLTLICSYAIQERFQKSCGIQAISVRATEGLLYIPQVTKESHVLPGSQKWMTCCFTALSTVFQSYRADGR